MPQFVVRCQNRVPQPAPPSTYGVKLRFIHCTLKRPSRCEIALHTAATKSLSKARAKTRGKQPPEKQKAHRGFRGGRYEPYHSEKNRAKNGGWCSEQDEHSDPCSL